MRIRDGTRFMAKMIAGIMLLCFFSLAFQMKTEAASFIPRYAWRDDAGNILIRTQDKQLQVSTIGYRTVGWTVTRCVLGTQDVIEDQYFTIKLSDMNDDHTDFVEGDQVVSCFVLSEAEVLRRVAEVDSGWLADIQSGETCYLMFDAIMVTFDNAADEIAKFSGFLLSETNQDYMHNPANLKPGVYDKFTYEDLIYHTYGWAEPEGIRTHFNIPLLYNGGEVEPPVISDEYVTTIGKDKPEYYTWNTSSEFDLSQGIPSGENITNGYGADKWYGNVDIGLHEETRNYTLSYDLLYHTFYPTYEKDEDGTLKLDENGNLIPDGGLTDVITHVPMSFTVSRKASYYYAMGINLYELKKVDVANSTYPGDVITYILNGTDVLMKTILDGETNPSTVTDWTSTPEKHILWPEPYTSTIQIDCGEGRDSMEAMKNVLSTELYNDVINGYDYIKGVTSWNDLVQVNGVKYMDDEKVTHANDTSKVRKEYLSMTKGKDDKMYLFHEKQKTVTIPKTVANGSYATGMEVLYNHRILNDNKVMAFSTYAPDSIYNHLKSGYEKNEPVYVHTPVISPVSIKDAENSTQLITENKTGHAGYVDKDGRVPDGKAIYELILDHNYTFDFDAALHREIQGYGWSGDPSKYDKYVKGKYVCFPFEVQLEIDGEWTEFYKPDNSIRDVNGEEKLEGYTQWIELPHNEVEFYIPSWAMEGEYYEIRYKVEAYNVFDESGEDHSDAQEGTGNVTTNGNNEAVNYVATYVLPTELSGIIYDFEIIGTNAYEKYNEQMESGILAFSPRRWEKKQGDKNREGGSAVRYTLDGQITNQWQPIDILPLSKGTSSAWDEKGYMTAGETITFSVKTIANLWDEGVDGIFIKPTFRWYDYKGTEHSDLQIYYWDDTDSEQMIRYNSSLDNLEMRQEEEDGTNNSFSFWNMTLAGSAWDCIYTMDKALVEGLTSKEADYTGNYHDPDLIYTLNWHNRNYTDSWSLGSMMKRTTQSYCLSAIELTSEMRLLTGKYEELTRNLDKPRDQVETFQLDADTADKMRYSMQTWYGAYTIPTNMLICDADTFENMGIPDHNNDGVSDYWDYLVEKDTYVNEDEDFWLNRNQKADGYLVLNFDIKTVNNGKAHLTYHGGTKDMWQLQGAKDTVDIGSDLVEESSGGKYPVITIPAKSGDIAVVNPNESIYDRYQSGILMIN